MRIKFVDEIFKIESRELLAGEGGREEGAEGGGEEEGGGTRMKKPDCNYCKVSHCLGLSLS